MINLDLGILYLFAVSELAVYGIFLSGWASGSKYSLLGSLRSSASLISYELGLGLALLAPVLLVGSLNLNDIVNWQKEHGWLFLYAFPAFLVYLIASMAEAARTPFDLPEAEQELVGGYHTEYSSIKWALFQMAEYIHFITASALIPTLFLGGWTMPVSGSLPLDVPQDRLLPLLLHLDPGHLVPPALRPAPPLRLGLPLPAGPPLVPRHRPRGGPGPPRTYLLYLSALSFLVLLGAVLYTPKPARKGGGA